MIKFHRTRYEVPGKGVFRASWWQLGDRVWRFRETLV